jgi:hypothetical protein
VRAFLKRISPLNNAEKITVPLSIAHGEEDSRVPVGEALHMWDIASKEGLHGVDGVRVGGPRYFARRKRKKMEEVVFRFKQKSVIEFTNAAKIHFLERFFQPDTAPSPLRVIFEVFEGRQDMYTLIQVDFLIVGFYSCRTSHELEIVHIYIVSGRKVVTQSTRHHATNTLSNQTHGKIYFAVGWATTTRHGHSRQDNRF